MLQPTKCHRCGTQENKSIKKGPQWIGYCAKCGTQVRIYSKRDSGFLEKEVRTMIFGPYKGRIISTLTAPDELEFLIRTTRTSQQGELMSAIEAHLETVYSPVQQEA